MSRDTACTRSVSIALGAGSFRIWLVVGVKRQRDERLEPAGVVLQRARAQHVVHALLHRLDVPVEHRHVCAHTEAMRETVNGQIAIRAALVVADLLADAVREDLRAAAGQ
jgi:hypothetical protein